MSYTRLNPPMKTASGSKSYTIAASSRTSVNISLTIPSGYAPCGVIDLLTGNTWVDVVSWSYSGGVLSVNMRNRANDQYTATASATVGCMKI